MKSIDIKADIEGYKQAHSFVGNTLKNSGVAMEMIAETMLVFEALYYNMTEQGAGSDSGISISITDSLGDVRIRIGFEGRMFDPFNHREDPNEFTPEDRLLQAYADKIDYSYHSGFNIIRIYVRRNYSRYVAAGLVATIAAILVYYPISMNMDAAAQHRLLQMLVVPVETLFRNAILMIGAPVTFLSLIRNLSNTYIMAERNSRVRKLQYTTATTSVIAIIMAVFMSLVMLTLFGSQSGLTEGFEDTGLQETFSNAISNLISSDIFTPFMTTSPFPLVLFAAMVTYACCSVGKYFDAIRMAVDASYALFSRMLSIVMFALPFFIFTAIMDRLLSIGYEALLSIINIVILVLISLPVFALFYAWRLKSAGVSLRYFASSFKGMIAENFSINSAIDAAPFNIRYCARQFKVPRKTLEESLPVLAQINLDGNCYIITTLALVLLYASSSEIDLAHILGISVLVLFLSLGAPNQPGSCVIAMMIITMYLNVPALMSLAIYSEFLFGGLLNLINVTGDIVTVVGDDAREKRKQQKTGD